jgi:1-acyl-sn-glycerol-3-phosphate acyltransferase
VRLLRERLRGGPDQPPQLSRPGAPAAAAQPRPESLGPQLLRHPGVEVETVGTPPDGAFVLVCNHVSYVDIPLLAAHLDATFVAKTELAGWPLLGRAFRIGDTIFIDRARKRDLLQVMERIAASLDRGLGVVIFPEGTSGRGDRILPLKASLLELAVRQGQPVHFATLGYRLPGGPSADQVVCWWDETPFLTHLLRLLAQPGFTAVVDFGERPIVGEDRKQLAERLHRAMQERFRPMTGAGVAS